MKTARELGHEHTSCNGDCCALGHEHTTACAHNRDCDRLTAAIEARDAEHAARVDTAITAGENILARERDLARSQLETAVGALKMVAELGEHKSAGSWTTEEKVAREALDKIAALATSNGTRPPGSVPAREASEDAKGIPNVPSIPGRNSSVAGNETTGAASGCQACEEDGIECKETTPCVACGKESPKPRPHLRHEVFCSMECVDRDGPAARMARKLARKAAKERREDAKESAVEHFPLPPNGPRTPTPAQPREAVTGPLGAWVVHGTGGTTEETRPLPALNDPVPGACEHPACVVTELTFGRRRYRCKGCLKTWDVDPPAVDLSPASPPLEPPCQMCQGRREIWAAGPGADPDTDPPKAPRKIPCPRCRPPEVPTCASWCGIERIKAPAERARGVPVIGYFTNPDEGYRYCYCSPACRDLGHPRLPVPRKGTNE